MTTTTADEHLDTARPAAVHATVQLDGAHQVRVDLIGESGGVAARFGDDTSRVTLLGSRDEIEQILHEAWLQCRGIGTAP